MVDRDRLLARLDEMDGYLAELRAVAPAGLSEYKTIEKRRACERLGLRNLLVHEYGRINDEIVFETITHRLGDFEAIKREVLDFLRRAS